MLSDRAQALPRASLVDVLWFGVETYLWTRPPTLNPGLDCTRLEKGRKTKIMSVSFDHIKITKSKLYI